MTASSSNPWHVETWVIFRRSEGIYSAFGDEGVPYLEATKRRYQNGDALFFIPDIAAGTVVFPSQTSDGETMQKRG